MRQNWIRNIVGGLSFTTALFIFQACYGTPQDFGLDVFVEGKVVSKTTGEPIKGIKVSAASLQHTVTDDKGMFSFYTVRSASNQFRRCGWSRQRNIYQERQPRLYRER
ncbi:MAG TPA: hypothetical protein PLI30_01590 [Petrimonas sp.]|nr:hypothetical protein [Petrimonas sp.]